MIMKKVNLLFILTLSLLLAISACKPKEEDPNDVVLGEVTVNLDANKAVVRTQEAVVGNFVADALKEYSESLGETVDFAVFNGGGIRFDSEGREDGIYPAGDFTVGYGEEMFPYGNTVMVVEVTGEELKTIFEHSISGLPVPEEGEEGRFLQVSKEIKVEIDLSKQVEVLNETDEDNPIIVTPGERITSLKINGTDFDSTATYTFATSNYIGEGGDSYVALANIDAAKRKDLGELCQEALKYYLEKNESVEPVIEGRIIFK